VNPEHCGKIAVGRQKRQIVAKCSDRDQRVNRHELATLFAQHDLELCSALSISGFELIDRQLWLDQLPIGPI